MNLTGAIAYLESILRDPDRFPCSNARRQEYIQLWRWLVELHQYHKHIAAFQDVHMKVRCMLAPGEVSQCDG